jgi:hypothetical protein
MRTTERTHMRAVSLRFTSWVERSRLALKADPKDRASVTRLRF